jgi:hypothetical protein
MAKKSAVTCERKKDFYTPCYKEDGNKGLDQVTGKCIGCGRTTKEIDNPGKSVEIAETVELTQEQQIEMKKIHKELYKFFKAMENAMFNGLVKGKTGWSKYLPIELRDKITYTFNKLLEGKNVEKDSIDTALYSMMIWRKANGA